MFSLETRKGEKPESKIIVYRKHFLKLLAYPKSLRDQLLFELPLLQAFRTGEIVTLRVEDVDFENGDIYVLDSKKHKYFPVPLDPRVAEHLEEYIKSNRLTSGYIIQKGERGRPAKEHQETSIVTETIVKVWQRYCIALDLPEMSPRMGRAYFSVKWHFVDGKSVYGLMAILRHTQFETTVHYLAKLIDYPSVRSEFYQGIETPFASECARSKFCPNSCHGCHCKAFTPQIEAEVPQIAECAQIGCHFRAPGCRCKTYTPLATQQNINSPRESFTTVQT